MACHRGVPGVSFCCPDRRATPLTRSNAIAGVFDKDGQKDLKGTLNLLTPEVVAAACKEATDGVSISLK